MIFYVNLAVSDFERSAVFYDAFLAEFDAKRFIDRGEKYIAWGNNIRDTLLSISPKRSTSSNENSQETVVAFAVDTTEEVDRISALAEKLGASVSSAPKLSSRDSYSASLRDFDGHTLRLYCMTA